MSSELAGWGNIPPPRGQRFRYSPDPDSGENFPRYGTI